MIDLNTLVLAADGHRMAPVGRWLHAPEAPFPSTVDAEGQVVQILGASLLNADDVREEMLAVTIAGRERAPIIGTASTRLYSVDTPTEVGVRAYASPWRRLDALDVGEHVRLPERSPIGGGLVVAIGCVTRIRRADEAGRAIWPSTPKVCGTLRVQRGSHSFATPGAFIHAGWG